MSALHAPLAAGGPLYREVRHHIMEAIAATAANLLDIAPAERVFCIGNVLSLAGRAVIVDDITLPRALFPGLNQAEFVGRENTIYYFYQSRFGIIVLRTHERLRAVSVPRDIAPLLGVSPNHAVLRIQRVALTYRARPVELRISHVNTVAHECENTFGKAEGLVA